MSFLNQRVTVEGEKEEATYHEVDRFAAASEGDRNASKIFSKMEESDLCFSLGRRRQFLLTCFYNPLCALSMTSVSFDLNSHPSLILLLDPNHNTHFIQLASRRSLDASSAISERFE